jgi:hypothetical protein
MIPMIVLAVLFTFASMTRAAHAPVGLGTADTFAVLGGTTVTNTGPTVISGDLGVSPGSAVTGFPPGLVNNGAIHAADAVATQAQADLTTAYDDAAGRTMTADLTGQDLGTVGTLTDGTYRFTSSAQLTGTLTLDGQGNANAVFVFQIGSTLTTASASTVSLINGAQACNVYWQVGSSATLGTTTTFRGTIMALTSIALQTGATIVEGRALARNGAVTLDTNTITRDTCRTAAPAPIAAPTAAPTTAPTTAPAPATTVPNTGVAESIDAGGDKLILVAIAAGCVALFALTLFRRQWRPRPVSGVAFRLCLAKARRVVV